MIIAPGFIGIDVSKNHLDIFDGGLGGAERIDNRTDAVTALVESWRGRGVFVLFEATGRYDALLRHGLAAGEVAHARVNLARARDFARATGALAKLVLGPAKGRTRGTDAIDAKLLAAMAMTLRPRADAPQAQDRERLASLNLRRDQLVADRTRERGRREALDDPLVADDIAAHMAFLAERIAAIEAAIARLVKVEPALADDARLLRSMPGFGPVAATTLIAAMPELGARPPKRIAALAGLAPFNRDSGAMRGKRAIRGGRRRVRKALYMAAVTAIRSQPRFAEAYKAFIARGKPAKTPSSRSPESSSSLQTQSCVTEPHSTQTMPDNTVAGSSAGTSVSSHRGAGSRGNGLELDAPRSSVTRLARSADEPSRRSRAEVRERLQATKARVHGVCASFY